MTSLPPSVERALDTHDDFHRQDDIYTLDTVVFDTSVSATGADATVAESVAGDEVAEFDVTATLPSLSAVVADETAVAQIVEDEWSDTLEQRLQDLYTVATTDVYEDPLVERSSDAVRIQLRYVSRNGRIGVADAKTLLEYVEGTYAQGLIPGYEYEGVAATLLEGAKARGGAPEDGGSSDLPL